MSGWRAQVREDYVRMGVTVEIGRSLGEDGWEVVLGFDPESGAVIRRVAPAATLEPGGHLLIPADIARALYDALARHYGHGGDTRTMRADFEHQRTRVDKLTDALTDLALRPAGGTS